jgi:dUTP pyrophosphatase
MVEAAVVAKICKVDERAQPLRSAYDHAAGMDIAVIDMSHINNPICGDSVQLMRTGWSIEVPPTHYVEIHARSSLHKLGWTLANNVGIIDSDYRGEILIALSPLLSSSSSCSRPQPIDTPYYACQLIVKEKVPVIWKEVSSLTTTNRGDRGFGSSSPPPLILIDKNIDTTTITNDDDVGRKKEEICVSDL